MGRPSIPFDWPYIRGLYESGQTAYQIAKRPDCPTKQAIQNRADKEGWHKPDPTTYRPPILAESLNINSHKLTDEVLRVLLGMIAEGATIELACKAAGISNATYTKWCRDDPSLRDAVQRARAGTVAGWLGAVNQATRKDWKAATWLLQNSPDTRDSYGAKGNDSKLEIVININRETEPRNARIVSEQ